MHSEYFMYRLTYLYLIKVLNAGLWLVEYRHNVVLVFWLKVKALNTSSIIDYDWSYVHFTHFPLVSNQFELWKFYKSENE